MRRRHIQRSIERAMSLTPGDVGYRYRKLFVKREGVNLNRRMKEDKEDILPWKRMLCAAKYGKKSIR